MWTKGKGLLLGAKYGVGSMKFKITYKVKKMSLIQTLKNKVLEGGEISFEEALALAEEENKEELYDAAAEITAHFGKPEFNPCSIINARAGKCSENCKWCAQSGHYHTDSDVHGIVSEEEVLRQAKYNQNKGVKRFSLVTSGRAVKGEALKKVVEHYRKLREETDMYLCGSLGLLDKDELQQLWDAGMRMVHCNLETAPSYFSNLCTTHTIEDKMKTIRAAQEIGFKVCSGGIIGLGESRAQRIELGMKLREANPDSIPINILQPIKGTPLENTPLIDEEEILLTIAIYRFLHPKAELRFAGGRKRLSQSTQLKALHIGINSAVVGDLLTTVGSAIDEDKQMALDAGYKL